MNIQHIRDNRGKSLGFIEEDSNGRLTARNPQGLALAHYYPKENRTRDTSGKSLVEGNILAAVIMASHLQE